MTRLSAAAALMVALAATPRAAAQVSGDTVLSDTLAADTVDKTARFLEAQQKVDVRLPVLPRIGASLPLPPRTRLVFDRDSLQWLHGQTLGDLLAEVPGTYLWRGGWYGRTESVNYRGRGVNSTEYLVDGMPYIPMGIDSVGVDPAFLSLRFLERVEVERLPGKLRVHLFTRRHNRLAPRSNIGVATGYADIARYDGGLERRTTSGLGFVLAADYLSSPTASALESRYSNNHFWLQGSYLPNSRVGVQYQLIRSAPNRRPYVVNGLAGEDTLTLGYKATRTDGQLRVSYHPRADGLGPTADLLYGRSRWDGGGVTQSLHQLGGLVSLRSPTFAMGGSAFYRSRWTPLDTRANLAWTPLGPLSASAELAFQAHDDDRSSRWLMLRGGLGPVGGLSVSGAARIGRDVQAPSVETNRGDALRDYELIASWQRERLGVELAYTRVSDYDAFAPAEYVRIADLGSVPPTEWMTVALRLAPLRWLTVDGWYSDPRQTTGVEGIPPSHSIIRGTIRSKFWRTFPSGIFDLKLQIAVETWGTGVIGRDADDARIALPGATMARGLIEFELGKFGFFWDRGNLTGTTLGYVPGFRIPAYGTTFGVRWEFMN